MREIMIKNNLTGKKEILKPLTPGHVKMYACGVTPYDSCHIGHAMQAIFFDVMRRFMEFAGYRVTYVRNFTDVDDKIINRSKDLGILPLELSEKIIAESRCDLEGLGVAKAHHEPKVSEMIPEIIEMIQTLIDNQAAYSTKDGDVYYRVRQKADYGKLSNRKTDELRSGAREIVQGSKEDELDFALWKADETPGASWKSPWGLGRPGWHIECSAMSKRFLGDSFDIHGGGRDLIFPHHENEIAQSESANGKPYASIWIHSGLLTLEKQKMSKSLGNFILINSFLKTWPGEVLRLSYLSHHYSSDIDFSEKLFAQNRRRLLYYYETIADLQTASVGADGGQSLSGFHPDELLAEFQRAMCDDFNTGQAIAGLNVAMKKAKGVLLSKESPLRANSAKAYLEAFKQVGSVLGILTSDPNEFIAKLTDLVLPELKITREEISHQIDLRTRARDAKDWQLSDKIRTDLQAKGILLRDHPKGTLWSIEPPSEV